MKIIFLGPPGSGKGTYSTKISSQKGIPHISTGELFREEIKNQTELGRKANEYIQGGRLVPDELVIGMLKNRLDGEDCRNGFILDGFPRTLEQARALESISNIDVVINLVIPDGVIVKKISARRVCEECGENYNIADIHFGDKMQYRMPPILPKRQGICDRCDGNLIQRRDDSEDVVRERLGVYKKQTEPLIQYYREKGLLKDVEVTGSPEVMIPKILNVLGGL